MKNLSIPKIFLGIYLLFLPSICASHKTSFPAPHGSHIPRVLLQGDRSRRHDVRKTSPSDGLIKAALVSKFTISPASIQSGSDNLKSKRSFPYDSSATVSSRRVPSSYFAVPVSSSTRPNHKSNIENLPLVKRFSSGFEDSDEDDHDVNFGHFGAPRDHGSRLSTPRSPGGRSSVYFRIGNSETYYNVQHPPRSNQKSSIQHPKPLQHPAYSFGYDISNPHYHQGGKEPPLDQPNFGHYETRTGSQTKGSYSVHLPDGRKQVVQYYADETGYHPIITYH